MDDLQQSAPTRGFSWETVGPLACMLVAAGLGTSQTTLAWAEGDLLVAAMYAVTFTAVFIGLVGRLGIPSVEQRSRLPDAVQGMLLGALAIAGTVIVLEHRSLSILPLAFAYPVVFPALVPQAIYRRLARWPAEEDEDRSDTGPRWQDLASSTNR